MSRALTDHIVRFQSRIPAPRSFVWALYTRPGMFERLTPPWQRVEAVTVEGGVRPGDVRVLRLALGPLGISWHALHGEYIEGELFSDRQLRGPFRYWDHRHVFLDEGPAATVVRDEVTFELPVSAVSDRIARRVAGRELRRLFAYRHFTAFHDFVEQYNLGDAPRLRVQVTGDPAVAREQIAAYLSIGGHEILPEDSEAGALDLHVGLRAMGSGGIVASIGPGGDRASTRTVSSAFILDPSLGTRLSAAVHLARTPGSELGWTTIDDYAAAIQRALLDERGPERILVAHPSKLTAADFGFALSMPARLGALVSTGLTSRAQETGMDCSGGPGEAEDEFGAVEAVEIRSRFRDARHALSVMTGRI